MTDLGLFANGFVDDVVVFHHLFLGSIGEILHSSVLLLQVYVAKPAVKEHFARVQLEEQPKLGIVNHCVAAEVQQGIVEIGQSLLEVAEKEIRDALLKVRNGKILIKLNASLIALDLENHTVSNSVPPAARHGHGVHVYDSRKRDALTAFSCSPRVAWITPMLKRILLVSAIFSNSPRASSNSLLS